MAKQEERQQKTAEPVAAEQQAPEPVAEPVVVAKRIPLPAWKIASKDGTTGESIVEAETVEDAIRVFNGDRTNFAAKQLHIAKV